MADILTLINLSFMCPKCGEYMIEPYHCIHDEKIPPMVDISTFEQTTFECDNCGSRVFTGEIDYEEELTEDEEDYENDD